MNVENLYLVTIKNMRCYYVVSPDPTTAYKTVRDFLDNGEWFFEKDRGYHDVKQVGTTNQFDDNYTLMFLTNSERTPNETR